MPVTGADALVLFNRLFEPDVDIVEQKQICPFNFSYETDYRLSLRYMGLLEGMMNADICCSTGIFTGETVVKMLLAGASTVQTVSALFARGYGHVANMLREVRAWMDRNGYASLAEFRGRLSKRRRFSGLEGREARLHPTTARHGSAGLDTPLIPNRASERSNGALLAAKVQGFPFLL